MQRLTRPAELVDATNGDPIVRHLLPHVVPGGPLLALDGAVLFVYDYWDGHGAQLVGPASLAAALLNGASTELPTDYVAIPEDALPLLTVAVAPETPWRFRWTQTRPPAPTLAGSWLPKSADAEVEAMLALSFPDASARPGNRHARRWAGIRDADGALIACAADCTESDIGFMASVASDVRLRRSGLGQAMTTWMTHALLDEHPIVALWQYSDNAAASGLYDKLGFHDDHRYIACVLTRERA
ncbi:MAG: GNAT family N-acetyltransferase [Actinomycetota bacterium]